MRGTEVNQHRGIPEVRKKFPASIIWGNYQPAWLTRDLIDFAMARLAQIFNVRLFPFG